jgi:transposase
MCPAINNPASRKIRTLIRFLHAENMSAAEIHRELCAVYGQNLMSEGTVRKWCGMFKAGQINFHNEERCDRPSVLSDELVQNVDQKYL